ncbi:hypothetical protein CUN61_10805 [Pseudomonas arsenicoxydans]|uniref:Transposase DDE domain-containing protein n=1 Tax=Pseudomonas arsenicoxydans TaxID=702115 RepID=A0A4P6G4X1_9PSED|nr:hypothetical protein CUN61_10805 [Pseudomonas arsenicoxydans]
MQLGFDRQHFTLPRVGIFLGLNKWLPVARQTLFDKSWASVKFLFEFVVKGLVTDQFHLVRIVGRLRHLGVAWSVQAPRRPTSCSR